jgi:hypothetical protein
MIPKDDQSSRPLSKDDLYGKSERNRDEEGLSGQVTFDRNNRPLEYEETPIIEPVQEPVPADQTGFVPQAEGTHPVTETPETKPIAQQNKSSEKKSATCLGNIAAYLLVFILGITATIIWRMYGTQFMSSVNKSQVAPVATPSAVPTETPESTISAGINPTVAATPPVATIKVTVAPVPTSLPPISVAGWKTTGVGLKSGYSVPPMSIQLPPELEELSCDPPGCTSEGTDLPGGTRFTVAIHAFSKPIMNFTKSKVTDASGRSFPDVSETAVSGKPALLFSGEFTGSTLGGYTFSRMRGIMVLVDPKLTLEINHFTYTGKSADFAADDKILDRIISTVTIGE